MTGSDRYRRAETDGPRVAADPAAEPDADPAAESDAGQPQAVAAGFAIVVFVASVVPVPTAPFGGSGGGAGSALPGALPVEVGITGPFHFLGYTLLAALLVRAAKREPRGVVGVAAAAAIAAAAFGFGIELVQAPIPWRSFAWSDAAVNAVGAVVGAAGYALRRSRETDRIGG